MGIYPHSKQQTASNLNLISFSLIQFYLILLVNLNNHLVHSFILPAVDNTSTLLNLTKINEKINERQLSFSELYPNLASLHQLLTSFVQSASLVDNDHDDQFPSIEHGSDQEYVRTNSPATPTDGFSSFATTAQSPDTLTTEELLSKDKSIINIKFIKKLPRKLEIKKQRRKLDYLKDKNLNFDSAYLVQRWNNCTVKFKSHVKIRDTDELFIHNNYELQKQNYSKQIHVQIEGADCLQLPIRQLKSYANITSLVVTRTGIEKLEKYVFGVGGLMKLEHLYIHNNNKLTYLKSRSFDGLSFLSYLSIINNENLSKLDASAFAGIKNCEELIYIGNGLNSWSYDYFSYMIKVVSSRILPNLVHFHLSKTKCVELDEDEHEFGLMKRLHEEFFNETSAKSPSLDKLRNKDMKKPNVGIKVNKNDLMYIDQVKYLQLEDCDLAYLSPDAFEPLLKNLIQLNLAYNPLISVSNLKQLLRTFFVTNSYLSALKNKKKLLKNQSYSLKDTDQSSLNTESQIVHHLNSSSPYLNQSPFNGHFNAFVNSNNVNNLSSGASNGLDTLDLSGVLTAQQIPKDLLVVISKTTIKQLYLRNLFWKELQVGDLPSLPNLQVLHLDYSFLEQIDENVFNNCDNLVSLSLRGNLLSTIPLNMLEPLVKLEKLDLSGYKSSEQDLNFYRKFTFCKKTFVYGTQLKELNLNFKNLELRQTNLKYVEYLVFFSLKSIVKINLSDNPLLVYNIRLSEEDSFTGLEAIEEVNLSGCNITDLDLNDQNQNVFKRMKENLKYLDLSNNLITKIDAQTFADFNELRTIDLSYNKLQSWHAKLFAKNQFIMSLDVSHNNLKEISPEMLADFRRLKRLGFDNNPIQCDCAVKGSILWLNNDNKQKKILNKLNNHEIQEHLESLVNRQQQIVSTVYAADSQPAPKSIIDWLENTSVEFLNEQHPLRSTSYYCHLKESQQTDIKISDNLTTPIDMLNDKSIVPLGIFVNHYCLNNLFLNGSLKFTMLIVIVSSLMLLTTFCLMIALVYNSTLRRLITIVDEDFIHNYEYDAFVSYNFQDSDWVLNNLVPSLEELPELNNNNQTNQQSSSKIHFSSIYQENDQYNLRTWIRNNKSKKSSTKLNQKLSKEDLQSTCSSNDGSSCGNKSQKIKLCVYERDFIAGKQINDCITESIRSSRKVILVISKNFAQSPWCRYETDLAHHTLVDQNRDGLILIKLEDDLSPDFLEKTAPQLHFLLKTRIYISWSTNKKEQEIFWKKLHSALGFNKTYNGTYNHIRNMYHYCTNQKQDLSKRRPSVVLAPTQNELQINYENEISNNLANDDKMDLESVVIVKEADQMLKVEKISELQQQSSNETSNDKSNETLNDTSNDRSYDTVDYNNNVIINKNDVLDIKLDHKMNCNKIKKKLENDNRIELRNFNQFLNNNYDTHLPFYRLLYTQNLLPHLYDMIENKFVFFRRLVINLVFSGFSFRS